MKDTLVTHLHDGGTVFISEEPSKPIKSIERIVIARSNAINPTHGYHPRVLRFQLGTAFAIASRPSSMLAHSASLAWTIDNAIWFPSKSDEGGIC